MDKNDIGVLIHGAGWVASRHIEAYKNNPRTRITAISSRTLESAGKRAAEACLSEVTCYDRLDQALDHPGIDLVSICTPQHLHCENVVATAEAGKHMIIEKPVGISLGQLQQMREAVRKSGVRSNVSFVLRWNPLFQSLKNRIARQLIGRPYYVETDYLSHNGSWWGGWNDARTLEKGVSAFLVAGCHAIDALRWFAGYREFEAADPIEVFSISGGYRKGKTDAYDPITDNWVKQVPPMEYDGLEIALVKFANGVLGKVTVNNDCIMPYRFPVRIYGDRGTIFDNSIWSHEYPDQKKWIEIEGIAPDSSDVSHHPFQGQIDYFVECIVRDCESHCNLDDAVKTHEVVFAALESQQTGRPISLPIL